MSLKSIPLKGYLAAGLIFVLSAAGWWGVREWRAGQAARAAVVQLQGELAFTRLSLELERARSAADAAAVSEEATAARGRQDALDALLNDIDRAPVENNAPVAPVLRDALRSLK